MNYELYALYRVYGAIHRKDNYQKESYAKKHEKIDALTLMSDAQHTWT